MVEKPHFVEKCTECFPYILERPGTIGTSCVPSQRKKIKINNSHRSKRRWGKRYAKAVLDPGEFESKKEGGKSVP